MPRGVYKRIIGINCGFNKGKSWSLSEESRQRISDAQIGKKHKKKWSEESRQKAREAKLKNPTKYWLGKNHSEETIVKIKKTVIRKGIGVGENNGIWIKDRSKLAKRQKRNDMAYKEWRMQVYKRDGFKCKINNSDCDGRIIAHHILSWKDYPELRYDVNNGIVLCKHHHPRTRKKEKETQVFFQELLNSKSLCEANCGQKI